MLNKKVVILLQVQSFDSAEKIDGASTLEKEAYTVVTRTCILYFANTFLYFAEKLEKTCCISTSVLIWFQILNFADNCKIVE